MGNPLRTCSKAMSSITTKKEKKIIAGAIIIGIILYLSKFLRTYYSGNDSALFILGFLPNFGLAFALPFIYVSNRIRLRMPVKHFNRATIITLLLMILNEIRDKYQPGRVFDWYDMYASFAAVICSSFVFHVALQ